MARFQIVDEQMEAKLILGRVYAKSDDEEEPLMKLSGLRAKFPDIQLMMIDTSRNRWPVA